MKVSEDKIYQRLRIAARQRGRKYTRVWTSEGRQHLLEPLGDIKAKTLAFQTEAKVLDWLVRQGYRPQDDVRREEPS